MDKTEIRLSQAIEGYFIAAHARRLSPSTLARYDYHLRKLEQFLPADPLFAADVDRLHACVNWLLTVIVGAALTNIVIALIK